MQHTINPVILCGGSGTRLWPLSTPKRPKQFLSLTSENSMIEETVARFETSHAPSLFFAEPLVVGSKQHADLLDQSLPDARKILEPFGRNSAPAVAAACLAYDPDALILILPADHDIMDHIRHKLQPVWEMHVLREAHFQHPEACQGMGMDAEEARCGRIQPVELQLDELQGRLHDQAPQERVIDGVETHHGLAMEVQA